MSSFASTLIRRRSIAVALSLICCVGGFGLAASVAPTSASNLGVTATLAPSPSSVSGAVGATVAVVVHATVAGDTMNAVEADIDYPASKLTWVANDINAQAWGITARSTGGKGDVRIAVATSQALGGDQVVATIRFTVKATGIIPIKVAASSAVISATTNKNLLKVLPVTTSGSTPTSTKSTTSSNPSAPNLCKSGCHPLLGITGNPGRFKSQTGQRSTVAEAFLGWGQGLSWGTPFEVLFQSLAPIPMIHLGTDKQHGNGQAISVAQIASGQGDAYLAALNQAIAEWGKPIYVRPLGEMNNPGVAWSGNPAAFRRAFARIYLLVHGGNNVATKLASLHLPAYRGPALASNPYPRVRLLWSALASKQDAAPYWPGADFVDVGGADIYRETGSVPPWQKFKSIYAFVRQHHRTFAVPEWGTFSIDDPGFIQQMCGFLKQHPTETEEFFESKPGSIFDLARKPASRGAYRSCITKLAGRLPVWTSGGPGTAKEVKLTLTPNPATGTSAPLAVQFGIAAKLTVPIVHWQLVYGDGAADEGNGPPPTNLSHTYTKNGDYEAVLLIFANAPFTAAASRFLTVAAVTTTGGTSPLSITPTPLRSAAPAKISFRIKAATPRPVRSWLLSYGDGLSHAGTGTPPRFAGHTYAHPGIYNVMLIIEDTEGSQVIATTQITAS